mgnify:FL=1
MILIEKQVRMGAAKKGRGYYEGYLMSACNFMVIHNVKIFLYIQNEMERQTKLKVTYMYY